MGNADPNKTKAGNKYEVKPQYEELSKQINMQHAINQCYECMRLSKEISQLDRCNNRQIISCRLYTTVYQPGNHRSVITGARQELQQLRVSTPALKQRLKWVADERAKQGESSATKVVKNRGWMRWNSAVENHGEQ
ncbi:phenolic glucoside malonyltransferase 1-like [Dorcoceras hygrometricum]|uniref:Phenolic glucoside malonyltransferase 1-like n=1 Tax=Dorcoceras hygrometricum TaxID=472368 RepID=A0A2Z7CTK1_9LAMI|nr:phenolic glucoside malonyltransferase 1-like [Dorcoceras hygrometricum]